MAKTLPYYPLYVFDFDEDPNVRSMSIEAVGLYILALNESWKRGSIPDDPKALALAVRHDPAKVRKIWPAVRACWIQGPTLGTLINPRQERERIRATEKSEQAADAARLRHDRKRKASADAFGYADACADAEHPHVRPHMHLDVRSDMQRGSESVSGSLGITSPTEITSPRAQVTWHLDKEFCAFRDNYLSTGAVTVDVDWYDAFFVWRKMDFTQKITATEHVKTSDPVWIKLPKNYLERREWERPPRPTSSKKKSMSDTLAEL